MKGYSWGSLSVTQAREPGPALAKVDFDARRRVDRARFREEDMAEAGMGEFSAWQIISFYITTFLFGIVLIWIYAAIRPRFGPGPKTAVIAGLTMWAIDWLLIGVSFAVAGMYPTGPTTVTIVWGLFEVPIAAVAGA